MKDLITKAQKFYTEHKTAVLVVVGAIVAFVIWKKTKK